MNLQPAYREGRAAALAEKAVSTNPYAGHRGRSGTRRAAWLRGFRSVDKEKAAAKARG